jgi:hypothetical protein
MNNRIFIFFVGVLMLISFISGSLTISTNVGESITPNFILNVTAVNSTNFINDLSCNILLTSVNGSVEFQNISTTSLIQNLTNLNVGTDKLNIVCWTDTETGIYDKEISVTKTGEIAGEMVTMLIWLLFIIAIIGNLTFFILTITKLALVQETIFGVLTTWGFYLLMIIVSFLSGLMPLSFIGNISDFFLTILVWSNGVLPLLSLIITMFIKGTQKKKPLSVGDLTGGRYG